MMAIKRSTKTFFTVTLTVALFILSNYPTSALQQVATVGQGTVEVEGNGRGGRLSGGAPLYAGDLIAVSKGARATIICRSNQLELVVPNDGLPRGVTNFCS